MKKVLSIALIAILVVSFAACGLGDGGGVSDFEMKSQEEILAKLSTVYMVLEVTSSDSEENNKATMIIAENDKAIYISSDGEETLYVKADKSFYYIDDGQKVLAYQGDDAESYAQMAKSYIVTFTMGFASLGSEDLFKAKGADTVAGRKCAKYAFELNLFVYKINYIFWFDYETGLCMKQEFSGSAEGESGFFKYEITELKLSGVNLDKYINLPTASVE